MTPAKVKVLFAFFVYAGNGGVAMQLPQITDWFAKLFYKMKQDPRIGEIATHRFGDVPLTMERNRVIAVAMAGGFDIVVMLDSDNIPDMYFTHTPEAKEFWDTSFNFTYDRLLRGLPTIVCSPYCGPPPHPVSGGEENVYMFYAEAPENETKEPHFSFKAYSRTHAAQMRGIQEIAAGPTGVMMMTTNAAALMPIGKQTPEEILSDFKRGKISSERCERLLNMKSWFFYEYTDTQQTQKASTEDVTFTREVQLAGLAKFHEPVVFCNWDAWAGHAKQKIVGKPTPIYMEQISDVYKEAIECGAHIDRAVVPVDFTKNMGPPVPSDGGEDTDIEDEDAIQTGADVLKEIRESPPGQHGVMTIPRMIGRRKVFSLGHVTPTNELQALAEIVSHIADSERGKALRIAEIGSWVGESAIAMHGGLGPSGGTIYCVDKFEGSPRDATGGVVALMGSDAVKDAFVKNTGDLLNNSIKLIERESVEYALDIPPQELDIVFIDANHEYEAVKDDIEAWIPHVQPNGILCGHDYTPEFPGVQKAVQELFSLAGSTPRVFAGTTIWFLPKASWLRDVQAREVREQAEEANNAEAAEKH